MIDSLDQSDVLHTEILIYYMLTGGATELFIYHMLTSANWSPWKSEIKRTFDH